MVTHRIKTWHNRSAYTAYLTGNSAPVTKEFRRLIKGINPDVVHHHNISLLGYGILKKQKNYLNLYTAHDYWLMCQRNDLMKNNLAVCESPSCFSCSLKSRRPWQLWRHQPSFKQALRDIDLFIAPSDYLKGQILKQVPLKAVTLPNFVAAPPSSLAPSGFSGFFLYASVLEAHKGILQLLKLFEENSWSRKLVIVGNGSLKEPIRREIAQRGLEQKVALLGWVDDAALFGLLRDAEALVLPSMWPENSPLIALEAYSVGTPVIGSNYGGLPEIVKKVDEHLIFNGQTELKGLLEQFSKNQYPTADIQKVYADNFSPAVYVERYLKQIQTLNS